MAETNEIIEKEEFVIHWDPSYPNLLKVMTCVAGILIIIAGIYGVQSGDNELIGFLLIILGIIMTIPVFTVEKIEKPKKRREAVIDDYSIQILYNDKVKGKIDFQDIGQIGCYVTKASKYPMTDTEIVGFWAKERGKRVHSIDLTETGGWLRQDLQKGLDIILSRQPTYGFEIEKHSKKCLDKVGAVYNPPRDKRNELKSGDIQKIFIGLGIIQFISSIILFVIFGEKILIFSIFVLVLGILLIVEGFLLKRRFEKTGG